MVVFITGLAAVGLAGFVSVASVFDQDSTQRPLASELPRVPDPESSNPRQDASQAGEDVLVDNPLYTTGELQEAACPAPELESQDPESMERFLNTMTDCLDASWSRQFSATQIPFQTPTRVFWETSGQGPCGRYPTENVAAFYCRANNGLYLGTSDIVRSSSESDAPETYTFLLSHEYAHHVQGEAGILGYYHVRRANEESLSERNEWTRKSELQANCLGGAFLGSIAGSFPIGEEERTTILEDAAARGDSAAVQLQNHGSPENGRLWTHHGMDRMDPAACNTWDARQDLVQ